MKQNASSTNLERINSIGLTLIYFLSTVLGTYLISNFLFGFSALSNGIPISLYPLIGDSSGPTGTSTNQIFLIAGIMLMIFILSIWGGSVVIRKIKSQKQIATGTFLILLATLIASFPSFFTQRHHLLNPAFYVVVGAYLFLVTSGLTHLWSKLIIKYGKTGLPWKTYLISGLVFLPVMWFVGTPIERMRMTFGDYLFKYFTVNIYFLDSSGYSIVTTILLMIATLIVVEKSLEATYEK